MADGAHITSPQPPGPARVGLCGWSISMSAYVRRFPLVEVQHTFYEPPGDALLTRWRASSPPGFEFTIKAWQLVTHESASPTYRRLECPLPVEHREQVDAFRATPPVLEAWSRTLGCARTLRATAVLLQCPRSFRPTPENVSRMRAFLGPAAGLAPLPLGKGAGRSSPRPQTPAGASRQRT